jgi:hypothetical protein
MRRNGTSWPKHRCKAREQRRARTKKARRRQERERERARAAWEKFSAKKQRPGGDSEALLLRRPDSC